MGAADFQRIIILTGQGFVQLISNFSQTADQLAGPVKIVKLVPALPSQMQVICFNLLL